MISAFEVFDPDRKGYVTVAQFRQIMEKLGERPLDSATVDEMIAYGDPEDSGQMYYIQFVTRVFTDFMTNEKNKAAAIAAAKNAKR